MNRTKCDCCVIIPFCRVDDVLRQCVGILVATSCDVRICLVVDGPECPDADIAPFTGNGRVVVLRQKQRQGPGAARNLGIRYCRENGINHIILLDSDCVAEPGFIEAHMDLHEKYPHVACIGCGILGKGKGLWASIDRVASWFTSIPALPARAVGALYHIPTTNMSLKLDALPMDGDLFDERLRTGEDILFLRALKKSGTAMRFEPEPVVTHFDRESFGAMLIHQFRWALHTYSVRAETPAKPATRFLLSLLQIPLVPFSSLAMTALTVWPWIRVSPRYFAFAPVLWLLYIVKAFGVAAGTLVPALAMRKPIPTKRGP